MPTHTDRSSTPEDEARARAGLDALRHAAADHDDWTAPWRALFEARLRGSWVVWVVALVAATVLGVGLFAVVHRDSTPSASGSADLPMAAGADTSAPTGTGGGSASTGADTAEIVVQVAGAVVRPGVFHLPAGSRIGDLVARAGGLGALADADRVDLAAPLSDGVLVYIPRRGETVPPGPVVGGGDDSSAPGSASVVDVNTATAAELDALPGVGPTIAAAIVAYRQQHGPFAQIDDLADVSGIGPAKLAQIRPHVHV